MHTLIAALDFRRSIIVGVVHNLVTIEFVKLWRSKSLLTEDLSLEPIRQDLAPLVGTVSPGWNSKDEIEFFEGSLFGFGQETEDEEEGDGVEPGVETKGSL